VPIPSAANVGIAHILSFYTFENRKRRPLPVNVFEFTSLTSSSVPRDARLRK